MNLTAPLTPRQRRNAAAMAAGRHGQRKAPEDRAAAVAERGAADGGEAAGRAAVTRRNRRVPAPA